MKIKSKFIAATMITLVIFAFCFSCAFAQSAQAGADNQGTAVTQETKSASAESAATKTDAKTSGGSDEDILKKSQNPVSNLINLPIEYDYGGGNGTTNKVLWAKPVIPMPISKKWNLITRALVNYQSLSIDNVGAAKSFGNGNITFFFSPKKPAKFMWGAGPIFQVPMANSAIFGSNKLGIGPSAVGVITEGPWVVGMLVNNVWGTGNGTGDLNQALFQPFVNYNMPKKWFVFSAPQITANWLAATGSKWMVPLGGGIGKMITVGHQPIVLSAAYYTNIRRPQQAYDWQWEFVMKFLFPE